MDKTNKTPLEEMLEKYYPILTEQEWNSGDVYHYSYLEYLTQTKNIRYAATQGFLAGQSSIKQEQKPSDEEIKLKLSVIISSTNTTGNEKLDKILELFTFASPSKEIDKETIEKAGYVILDKKKIDEILLLQSKLIALYKN